MEAPKSTLKETRVDLQHRCLILNFYKTQTTEIEINKSKKRKFVSKEGKVCLRIYLICLLNVQLMR